MSAPDVQIPDESPGRRAFTFTSGAEYMRSAGFDGVTSWTLRRLAATGTLKRLKLGRRYFLTREALDELVNRLERRAK